MNLHTHLTRGLLVAAAAAGLSLLIACGGGSAQGASRGGPPSGGSGDRSGGTPALPTMAVAVEAAVTGDIATYYSATASLDPDKQARVLARTNGVVRLILTEEGDKVAPEQILLELEDDEYQHRVTLAEIEVEQQRLRFERTEKMISQGLVSIEDFDTTRTDLKAAEASLELARLELSFTDVRAPFTGRVVERLVDPGQNVSSGTPLFDVADMGRLLARVYVPARELRSIRADQPVTLLVTSTGDRLEGHIDLVSPVVDPSSGTVKITVEVTSYPPSTRPGDFVEVAIVTDRHTDVLLVPRVAVVTERGQRTLFVAVDDKAEQRQVTIGFEDDDHVEIVAGLEAGEMVVVQGQRTLRPEQPLKILDRLDLETDQEVPAAETDA